MRGDIVPKLFVFSDVHGFYNELRKTLNEVGFDQNNPEHIAVCLGDTTDRGTQPQEVIDYLTSLPRKVLIKGNHESLIMRCIGRSYPEWHDWHNGTAQTIIDLAPRAVNFYDACSVAYEKMQPFIDSMVNYYETKHYIFVHSFVPLKNCDGLPAYYTKNRKFEFNPDWRYAHASAWEEARWGNPFDLAAQGLLPDKTLVFGHYHTSWPRHKYEGKPEMGDKADFSPYYGNGYIGIDACTAYSKKVNVLVLEDEFLT